MSNKYKTAVKIGKPALIQAGSLFFPLSGKDLGFFAGYRLFSGCYNKAWRQTVLVQ